MTRPQLKAFLAVLDDAQHCVIRERNAAERLAKKFANDPDGWKAALTEFYRDHAAFVAKTMRLKTPVALAYADEHRDGFIAHGIAGLDDNWQQAEADELALLSMGGQEAA
jgi:hypothetical protein